jgi:hypothetical protein
MLLDKLNISYYETPNPKPYQALAHNKKNFTYIKRIDGEHGEL